MAAKSSQLLKGGEERADAAECVGKLEAHDLGEAVTELAGCACESEGEEAGVDDGLVLLAEVEIVWRGRVDAVGEGLASEGAKTPAEGGFGPMVGPCSSQGAMPARVREKASKWVTRRRSG